MTAHDYKVNFLLRLMSKDLLYAHTDAAKEVGVRPHHRRMNARALFESAVAKGLAEEDMAAVIEPIRAS